MQPKISNKSKSYKDIASFPQNSQNANAISQLEDILMKNIRELEGDDEFIFKNVENDHSKKYGVKAIKQTKTSSYFQL